MAISIYNKTHGSRFIESEKVVGMKNWNWAERLLMKISLIALSIFIGIVTLILSINAWQQFVSLPFMGKNDSFLSVASTFFTAAATIALAIFAWRQTGILKKQGEIQDLLADMQKKQHEYNMLPNVAISAVYKSNSYNFILLNRGSYWVSVTDPNNGNNVILLPGESCIFRMEVTGDWLNRIRLDDDNTMHLQFEIQNCEHKKFLIECDFCMNNGEMSHGISVICTIRALNPLGM